MSDAEAGPSSPVIFKKRAGRPKSGSLRGADTLAETRVSQLEKSRAANASDAREKSATSSAADDKEDEGDAVTHSVDDLVKLRAMRNKPQGISVDRLNKGDVKKKKKSKKDGASAVKTKEEQWQEQMERGGLVSRADLQGVSSIRRAGDPGADDEDEDEDNEDDDDDADEDKGDFGDVKGKGNSVSRRLANKDNFTEETATVDVDKHMMAFIEEEMKKRRTQERLQQEENPSTADLATIVMNNPSIGSLDELYSISDKYRQIQQSAREAIAKSKGRDERNAEKQMRDDGQQREREEGNVALSSSMLTSVPEIDLGIDSRLKNIEATERARRAMEAMAEARRQARQNGDEGEDEIDYGAARFFRHAGPVLSDAERTRLEQQQQQLEAGGEPDSGSNSKQLQARRRQTATDDAALDRFKKRQRNQLKR